MRHSSLKLHISEYTGKFNYWWPVSSKGALEGVEYPMRWDFTGGKVKGVLGFAENWYLSKGHICESGFPKFIPIPG